MKTWIKEHILRKTVYIGIAVAFIVAIPIAFALKVFAASPKTMFVNYLDGVFFMGLVLLLIGVVRWGWLKGDLTYFTWKPSHGSYALWKKGRVEEREGEKNAPLVSGMIVTLISLLLGNLI